MERDWTLQSERLTLTPLALDDHDIIVEVFADPRVVGDAAKQATPESLREEMALTTRRGGNGIVGVWRIALTATGEKLGTVALLPMPVDTKLTNWASIVAGEMPDADIEVGYFLKPASWGNGYATEACRRIVRAAFEDSDLREVVATHDPANTASRRVLIKSGFADAGTRFRYAEDSPYLRITRAEWQRSKAAR